MTTISQPASKMKIKVRQVAKSGFKHDLSVVDMAGIVNQLYSVLREFQWRLLFALETQMWMNSDSSFAQRINYAGNIGTAPPAIAPLKSSEHV